MVHYFQTIMVYFGVQWPINWPCRHPKPPDCHTFCVWHQEGGHTAALRHAGDQGEESTRVVCFAAAPSSAGVVVVVVVVVILVVRVVQNFNQAQRSGWVLQWYTQIGSTSGDYEALRVFLSHALLPWCLISRSPGIGVYLGLPIELGTQPWVTTAGARTAGLAVQSQVRIEVRAYVIAILYPTQWLPPEINLSCQGSFVCVCALCALGVGCLFWRFGSQPKAS